MIDSTSGHVGAIAAHRGWHADGAHENSIDALQRAGASDVDWVESDIRRLGDGTMVIHHDAQIGGVALDRLDRGVLARHPQIATLDDWARTAGELDVGVLAEFKEPGYEREALDVLRRHEPDAKLNVMSFDVDAVRALRRIAPELPVGLLTSATPPPGGPTTPTQLVHAARGSGASFLGLNVRQATEPVLAAADGAGLGVAVWTVDAADDLTRLLADRRVATVITDAPALALQLRSTMHGLDAAGAGVRLLRAAATMR